MAIYTAVSIKLPECQRLIDLGSIKRDFERCRDMCKKFLPDIFKQGLDTITIDAVATAIPITYARPFSGGIRIRITALLDEYSLSERVFHRQMMEMRSKFSAHSINGMEQGSVRVWLNPEGRGGKKINNVNTSADVLLALSSDDYGQLIELCQKAINWVDIEFKKEASMLPEVILKHFSLDELYKMEDTVTRSAGLESAHKGRSRLK
jgi:hypothetical protein